MGYAGHRLQSVASIAFDWSLSALPMQLGGTPAPVCYGSITDYVTKCCLGKQIFVIDGLDEVIRQQKAIGRNLNQITTLCNMGKVDCLNLQPLTNEYAKLNQTLTELLDRKRWAA